MNDYDVARDDLALDALAAGLMPAGDDEMLALLHAFRTDLEPDPVVVPLRRRPRRRGALVALSAAAGLVLGGLTAGAVVQADKPGELFYAAHKAVLGDPRNADRVTTLLDDAAERIAKGDLRGARDKLAKAAERLDAVEDPVARETLRGRWERLSALAASPVASPTARPSASASPDDDETPEPRETETAEPRETESADDSSGKGSGSDDSGSGSDSSGSGSGTSGGSGSDDGGTSHSGSDH